MREMVFEYSLIPHRGDWLDSRAYLRAREFTEPLLAALVPRRKSVTVSFLSADTHFLIPTALKLSEDGGRVVVRAFNITGDRFSTRLKLGLRARAVYKANLLEEPLARIGGGDSVELGVGPYEIVTLLLDIANSKRSKDRF